MWSERRTIGQRLFAGCGVLLLLTVMEGGVALWGSSRLRSDLDTVTKRSAELQRTLTIQTSLFKIESSVKSMLWAGVDNDRPLYEASKKASMTEYDLASRQVDELAAMLAGAEQTVARTLRKDLGEWKTIQAKVIELSDTGRFGDALQIITASSNPLIQAAEDAATSIGKLMANATDEAALSHSRSQLLTAIVIVLALTVGAFVVWLVRVINTSLRGVSRELGDGGRLVVDASSQMSVSAQTMSQGAAGQAASLEKASASMEQIAAMTRANADHSQQAASLMAEAARVLENSNGALADMVNAMTTIKQSSDSVSRIIKTIDEIAFQTNILSLNAAVEAARAGQAGLGFAVVADEVRSLAQRSAQAAKDTTALIEQAIASSSEGSQKVAQAAESFAAITSRVTEVKRLVDTVSVGSGQQAAGIEQVLQTIRQMETSTQTTAATAEQSAAASEQLRAQADVTMGLVERLKLMVDRHESRPIARGQRRAGRSRAAGPVPVLPLNPKTRTMPAAVDEAPWLGTGTYGPSGRGGASAR